MPGMRTDRELLEQAQAGDSTAIEEILSRHERQVFRYGLRMCGNEEDAHGRGSEASYQSPSS